MSMYYLNPATGKYELQGAPHVDAYSKAQTDALIAANAGVQMELLWENASPTSNFGAQAVAVDMSDGDTGFIVFNPAPNSSYIVIPFIVGEPVRVSHSIRVDNISGAYSTIAVERTIPEITETGIRFTDAGFINSATSANASNNCMIPVRIYIMKGAKKV